MRPSRTTQRGVARARVSLLLTTVLLATVLAACGSSEPEVQAEPAERSEASATPTDRASEGEASKPPRNEDAGPATVAPALDFQATTVAGEDFEGASVAGKPVVLWFWAPWCAVCRSQVPMVTGLAEQYGEDLAVLGVGSLDSEIAIAGFADESPEVTHLSDPEGALWKRFGIAEQSSFVVLDTEGQEVLRTGYDDDGAVEDAVADVTS